ncbi:hypothetical protein M0805_005979 [Coniferiporia weirii]|nr:hypothetical protein M0805_005979 [Coniferiporia weirii]
MSYYQAGPSQSQLSGTTVAPEELTAHSNQDAETLFSSFRSAPSDGLRPLAMPFCIPQATSGHASLFTRAYSPELQASGIEMDDWIKFIDGLNLAMTASPPLRVVNFVGLVLGLVPYHWSWIASFCMQTVAITGIHVLAKTLSDRLLRHANAEYFAPRGLRVRICKTAAMRQLIGLDAPTLGPQGSGRFTNYTKAIGRTAETVALHVPGIRKVVNHHAAPVPAIEPSAPEKAAARRMLAFEGYALPLSFDVPPPPPFKNPIDKASGLTMRLQTWRFCRREADLNHKRQVLAFQDGRSTSLPSTPTFSSSDGSQNRFEKTLDQRRARNWQKAEQRAQSGKPSKRLRQGVEVADRLEWKSTENLLWIVLVNAEQDARIQGTELVDGVEDVEIIHDADWEREMRCEVEEDRCFTEGGKISKAI